MGLLKPIMAPIGIPLEYHRITDVIIFTNEANIINVSSYINQEQRDKELASLIFEREKENFDEEYLSEMGIDPAENYYESPYSEGSTFSVPYDQYMTIESAYEYLKTLPEFEGAIDC